MLASETSLWVFFLISIAILGQLRVIDGEKSSPVKENGIDAERPNKTYDEVVVKNKKHEYGGGWSWGWGGGGGGGGGGGQGGGGWGWGGGGGGWWGTGCRAQRKEHGGGGGFGGGGGGMRRRHVNIKGDFRIGQFAQCVVRGRCRGMRLDCPLHCGGPCYYDCRFMCKAHCQRS